MVFEHRIFDTGNKGLHYPLKVTVHPTVAAQFIPGVAAAPSVWHSPDWQHTSCTGVVGVPRVGQEFVSGHCMRVVAAILHWFTPPPSGLTWHLPHVPIGTELVVAAWLKAVPQNGLLPTLPVPERQEPLKHYK